MSMPQHIAQRIAAYLHKQNAVYCEGCLIERLQIASRAGLRAALEMNCFTVRLGVCPDCRARKQVIARRAGSENVAA
jgi:hypothetical protein